MRAAAGRARNQGCQRRGSQSARNCRSTASNRTAAGSSLLPASPTRREESRASGQLAIRLGSASSCGSSNQLAMVMPATARSQGPVSRHSWARACRRTSRSTACTKASSLAGSCEASGASRNSAASLGGSSGSFPFIILYLAAEAFADAQHTATQVGFYRAQRQVEQVADFSVAVALAVTEQQAGAFLKTEYRQKTFQIGGGMAVGDQRLAVLLVLQPFLQRLAAAATAQGLQE